MILCVKTETECKRRLTTNGHQKKSRTQGNNYYLLRNIRVPACVEFSDLPPRRVFWEFARRERKNPRYFQPYLCRPAVRRTCNDQPRPENGRGGGDRALVLFS